MEGICYMHVITSFLIVLASILSVESGNERQYQVASTVFIRTSCSSTNYPRLCYSSLVKHADMIQSSRMVLTSAALNVTLAYTKSTSVLMAELGKSKGLKPREVAAMKDCVEQLSDSIDELRRSISEMSNLRASNFEMTISDLQTWVSAALTNENTCTDGFEETATSSDVSDDIKTTVRVLIVQIAQLTSNALALINKLANSHP